MRRVFAPFRGLLVWVCLLWPVQLFAAPPPGRIAVLSRGINITGWFRYPSSRDPVSLRAWLGDTAIVDLKKAGFSFIRLAVDPAVIGSPAMRAVFVEQVRRLQRHGIAVVIAPHPVTWSVDSNSADRARFRAFWHDLAPALRGLAPAMTFPEVMNEPVFQDRPADWRSLQHDLLGVIRSALPEYTIVLTGNDWGSVAGLLELVPESDDNVVYSFHFYDPAELTSLAAYRPGLDREVLARLPFPENDRTSCNAVAGTTGDLATRELILFWCATGWNEERVRSRIETAAAWARRHGTILLAGEFGASAMLNPGSRLAWLRLVRETCAENGIGWTLWGYDDVMGFNVSRPPDNEPALDRSLLRALGLSVL